MSVAWCHKHRTSCPGKSSDTPSQVILGSESPHMVPVLWSYVDDSHCGGLQLPGSTNTHFSNLTCMGTCLVAVDASNCGGHLFKQFVIETK